MATARRARLGAPGLRPVLAVAVAVAAVLAAVVPATLSSAAPRASIAQVKARIAALDHQAEQITESYDLARDRLKTLRQERSVAGRELHRAQARLSAVQSRISATADAAYRSGGLGQFVFDGATSPQNFLDQASMLDALSRGQARELAAAAAARHAVTVARTTYDARTTAVRGSLARIGQQRARIESLLAQARNQLDSLQVAQRARLQAAQRAEAAHQTAMRSSYSGPASGRAAAAVRFAYAQLGKPYVYGAAGPDSYDCSGLTMAAWAAAGVSLPHNAAAQQSMLHPVSAADLQPGDLVFFGSPAYHVGIYIGGGRIIQAPHTGDVVKITPLAYMPDFSGGGRP